MAQNPALLQRARGEPQQDQKGGATFKRPDLSSMTPPEHKDAVERVVAAGMRYLYSPQMRQEVMQALQSQEPMPQKLGMNVVGLVLTLDNQTQGGIPMAAVFPAAFELLGEAAEVMQAAGQTVTQEDFNTAGLVVMAGLAKKLGATDDQIVQTATTGSPDGGMAGGPAPSEAAEPEGDEMPEGAE